jgi:multidrug efflux pump
MDQTTSFQSLNQKLGTLVQIIKKDPAVEHVMAFTGGGQRNTASFFISLKPIEVRKVSSTDIINRLRPQVAMVSGASLFFQPAQDLRIGGRQSSSTFQYTLQAEDSNILKKWEPVIRQALSQLPEITDVDTDAQNKGVQSYLDINRDLLGRLGISMKTLDNSLYNAFGQRLIATIYTPNLQYKVVMEADLPYLTSESSLKKIYLYGNQDRFPVSSLMNVRTEPIPLAINHQSGLSATTVSFNLAPNISLGVATKAIEQALQNLTIPKSIQGSFQGNAKAFQSSMSSQPILILLAIVVVYLVLGMLYEDLLHPLTILSTLPSAGLGSLLALNLFKMDFSITALIAVFLLIGIVKKNAIMLIDVALTHERQEKKGSMDAIFSACMLRFRPIWMTTLTALLGAIPLVVMTGNGAELRQPLGISIVGGLLLSQLVTLYTTPVIYLTLQSFRQQIKLLNK